MHTDHKKRPKTHRRTKSLFFFFFFFQVINRKMLINIYGVVINFLEYDNKFRYLLQCHFNAPWSSTHYSYACRAVTPHGSHALSLSTNQVTGVGLALTLFVLFVTFLNRPIHLQPCSLSTSSRAIKILFSMIL